jgi:hypothetical protein
MNRIDNSKKLSGKPPGRCISCINQEKYPCLNPTVAAPSWPFIDDNEGSMQDIDEAFCRSFAADVRAFLDPLVHADWLATKDAA